MAEVDRPLLKEEDVRAAERREDEYGNHPVIVFLNHALPSIHTLNQNYPTQDELSIEGARLGRRLKFLVDGLNKLDRYELGPLDIVAIWSYMTEIFPSTSHTIDNKMYFSTSPYRTAMAGVISNVYAIQGAVNPSWRKFPYIYLSSSSLPKEVISDKDGLQYVHDRLECVRGNMREIGCYAGGTRESIGDLIRACINGDEGAAQRMVLHKSFMDKRSTPVLSDLSDGFGNGTRYASTLLEIELRKFEN